MGSVKELMDFYSGKKVIVTGGAGFVGSHLVNLLERCGAEVTILDNLSRGVNHSPDTIQFAANVDNYESVLFWFQDAFAVFNLAASVAGVLHNIDHNLDMYNENVLLQTIPVAAADAANVPHFLQTSTVCIYSPECNAPSQEYFNMRGVPHQANGGYAESKRDGERAIQWSGLGHAVIVRPSNIFGPRDHFDEKAHVIPALIRRVIEEDGDELHLYGPPGATREFVYVEDVAWGMMYALAFGGNKEAYNIGCNNPKLFESGEALNNVITMENLAEKILRLTDSQHKIITSNPGIGGGDSIRWADATKLRSLGWEHMVDIEWGLYETIEWYIDNREGNEQV